MFEKGNQPALFLRSAKCKRIHYTACFVFSKQAVFSFGGMLFDLFLLFFFFLDALRGLGQAAQPHSGNPAFKVENGRIRTPTASYISRETVIRFLNLFTRITVFSVKINTFRKKEKTK